jgi:PilZ domain
MMHVIPVTPDPDPESVAEPWADRRADDRRPVLADTRFEVRRSECEPDLAIALLDVSETGLKVAVRERLSIGDRVMVWIIPPSRAWVYRGQAMVCWWTDGAEETGVAGLEFRTLLPPQSVADMAEPDAH